MKRVDSYVCKNIKIMVPIIPDEKKLFVFHPGVARNLDHFFQSKSKNPKKVK